MTNGQRSIKDMPVFETSVHSINKISDSMLRHIKGYEKKMGAEVNEIYLNAFYRWIKELDELSDTLSAMERFEVWKDVESFIDGLPDDVGGLIIYLPIKQHGHYALLDLR